MNSHSEPRTIMHDHIYLKSFILGEQQSINKSIRDSGASYLTVRQTYEIYNSIFSEFPLMKEDHVIRGTVMEECILIDMLNSDDLPIAKIIAQTSKDINSQLKELKKKITQVVDTEISTPIEDIISP